MQKKVTGAETAAGAARVIFPFLSLYCVMEAVIFTFTLVFSFAVYSIPANIRDVPADWDDVVVTREGIPTTLICMDTTARADVTINWKVKTIDADSWKLVLSASKTMELFGNASKASMRLMDPNSLDTGDFSLVLNPTVEDCGLYSCMVKKRERIVKKTVILLAVLTVTIVPASPIPQLSTLQLVASVKPESAATQIIWAAPGGISMRSEAKPNTGVVAKVPRVERKDSGVYTCMVRPRGKSHNNLFPFNVDVSVDVKSVASFTNETRGTIITTATRAQTPFTVLCPGLQGDYVFLYWQPHGPRRPRNMSLLYHYDRWRGIAPVNVQSKRLQLAGPPYNAEAGSFSFLLTPELSNGGLYSCDVFLNDRFYSQRTLLSVFQVNSRQSSSKLELSCLYTEWSQIQSVKWTYQNKSRKLHLVSNRPGSIMAVLPRPITSETAGNYTCTLRLSNGQTVWATETVALPRPTEPVPTKESVTVATPSLLPSLSALLLLVPLVAGVLLWRQKHIFDHSVEQSLSVQCHEAENIYENPEDIRQQAPPEGSLYMDLKPRGEDGIYKELER